jgi:excisionase family DNA binding protein
MNGPFVPIEDLSKHFSVSVSTIRGWVRKGHIPKNTYIKVGNTYRFSIEDVSNALTQQPQEVASFTEAMGVSIELIAPDSMEASVEYLNEDDADDADDDF